MNSNSYKIFAGSSNPILAESIANELNLKLSDVTVRTFSDGEISILVNEDVSGCNCFIVQSVCSPANNNFMELLLLTDALKRAGSNKIIAVLPYLAYTRQDKQLEYGEPISASVVAKLIETAGIDEVITLELHSKQIQGFFNIPTQNLSCCDLAVSTLQNYVKQKNGQFVLLAPDFGSVAKNRKLAEKLDVPLVIMEKNRPKANSCEILSVLGDATNKHVLIYDDLIDTAGTICSAANLIIENNGALSVNVFAVHAVLSGPATERIENSAINQIFVTNSINPIKESNKIKVVDSSKIFSDAIKRRRF